MAKQNEKSTLPQAVRLTGRALRFWWETIPQGLILKGLEGVAEAVGPYAALWFSACILNEIAGLCRSEHLVRLAVFAVLSAAVFQILQMVLERKYRTVQAVAGDKKRIRFGEKLQMMDFSRMDDPHTFELYSNIQQSENWASWGLTKTLQEYEKVLPAVFKILGAIVLSVSLFTTQVPKGSSFSWINHPFAVVGVLAMMLLVTFAAPALTSASLTYWSNYNKEATLANRLFERMGFLAFVDRSVALDARTYCQEKFCKSKMRDMGFDEKSKIARQARGPMGAYQAAGTAVSRAFTGGVYLFVCLKAWAGAFGVGSVAQYVGAITSLSGGLSALLEVIGEIRANAPYLETVFEFWDLPNEMYQGSLTVEKRADRQYEVEFRHVSFRYPGSELWALKDVSLKFHVGERLAVVGYNGSGKTTMIKLLCRLYDPTEGEILLNGINIRKYNYAEYMNIFSVVFQDFQLLALPLGQNVSGSVTCDGKRALDALQKAGLGKRLAALPKGLDTCLYKEFDKEGVQVSGGEAQKIAIARALYKDAPFIVLDEPTAALDPVAEAEIYSGFDRLIQDRTAIYISHRLSSCKFCDRIAVFEQGRIVQFGTHDNLVADEGGTYYRLWQAQAQYYT